MTETPREGRGRLSAFLSMALLTVAFVGSFGLQRFHDDWTFVFRAQRALETGVLGFVLHPLEQHWSPLWHALEVLNFVLVGWESDAFIRTAILFFQGMALVSMAMVAGSLRLGRIATAISMAVLALHHVNGAAIYSFDTYSQCATDGLGWLGAACFLRSLDVDASAGVWRRFALAFLLISLLFKEQGLAAAGVYVFFVWVTLSPRARRAAPFVRSVAPTILVVAAFVVARHMAGTPLDLSGNFAFSPASAPRNMTLLFGALLTPVRTLAWLDAARAEPAAVAPLAEFFSLTLAWGALIVAGCGFLVKARPESARGALSPESLGVGPRRHAQGVLMVAGAMVISWFPVSLLAHVGELYVHSSLFWFALLVGCGAQGWISRLGARRMPVKLVAGALASAYVVTLAIGLRSNLEEMRRTGERAATWLAVFREKLREVPAGSNVVIRSYDPPRDRFDYGLYRITTPQYLVLTGISPWSIRYATKSRLRLMQDFQPFIDDPRQLFPEAPNAAVYVALVHDGTLSLTRFQPGDRVVPRSVPVAERGRDSVP